MNKTEQGELISALADGELQDDAMTQALQALEADAQLQFTWDTYHVVGDVLRSPDLATKAASAAFLTRLQPALAREAVDPAPLVVAKSGVPPRAGNRGAAANDRSWKIAAGLASFAAVLAVGWNVVGVGSGSSGQPQLAGAPVQPGVVLATGERNGERNVMLRDARLDELLAVHRQFGSATAIQMPTGAVRNAAFETPAR